MIRIKFDASDLRNMLEVSGRYVKHYVIVDLETEIKMQILKQKLTSEGHLLQSVVKEPDLSTVFINAPYAGFVEYGTPGILTAPPGMAVGRMGAPPLENIMRWAKNKLASKYGPNYSKQRKNAELKLAQEISRSIYLYGTKPHPFVRNAIDVVEMKYRRMKLRLSVQKVV